MGQGIEPQGLVIPIGKVDKATLSLVAEALTRGFGTAWDIGTELPHPRYAYDRRRRQYLASAVLDRPEEVPRGAQRILGVVDLDCYVPQLNFVFGLASPQRNRALIALPRLRQEFYGLPPDEGLFEQRVAKEAIHEIGHTCGLNHCPDPHCVMHFSNSLADTDRKSVHLCAKCRALLS